MSIFAPVGLVLLPRGGGHFCALVLTLFRRGRSPSNRPRVGFCKQGQRTAGCLALEPCTESDASLHPPSPPGKTTNIGRHHPISTESGPNLARLGPKPVELHRHRTKSKSDQHWLGISQNWAELGPVCPHFGPKSTRRGPKSTRRGPKSTNLARNRPDVAPAIETDVDQFCPELGQFERAWADQIRPQCENICLGARLGILRIPEILGFGAKPRILRTCLDIFSILRTLGLAPKPIL